MAVNVKKGNYSKRNLFLSQFSSFISSLNKIQIKNNNPEMIKNDLYWHKISSENSLSVFFNICSPYIKTKKQTINAGDWSINSEIDHYLLKIWLLSN